MFSFRNFTRCIDSKGMASLLCRTRRNVSLFSYVCRRSIGFKFCGFRGTRSRDGTRGAAPGLGLLFARSSDAGSSWLLSASVVTTTLGFGMCLGGVGA